MTRLRPHSPAMMLSPAAYAPYSQSHFNASSFTFSDTPITSPMQAEFHDSDPLAYSYSPQMFAKHRTVFIRDILPLVCFSAQLHGFAPEHHGHSPLASPPITPMEPPSPFINQPSTNSIKIEVDDRSVEYPISPYTPTYPYDLNLPRYPDTSRRPVSAGRLMPQKEYSANGAVSGIIPLKRCVAQFKSLRQVALAI